MDDASGRIDWVVFDLGGVVLRPTEALPELAARIGAPLQDFVTAYHAHRREYDRHSDQRAYWTAVAADCGVAGPDAAAAAALTQRDNHGWAVPDPRVLRLIDELGSSGTRLAVLSNAPASMGELVRGQPWATPFEHILISGELGLVKPEPAIYAELLRTLDSPAHRTAFIDDRADNVAAAADAGIRAVPFRGADELSTALAAMATTG